MSVVRYKAEINDHGKLIQHTNNLSWEICAFRIFHPHFFSNIVLSFPNEFTMPLSQLFEVLFDSSVVVKYPIFWTQKAKNRYAKKTDAVHLPKRRIVSCRTYRYPKWIALIPRRGRWNCRNLSFTAWTYFIISRIISMCLPESLRMKNFLAVFNAEEKSSS